MSKSTRRQFLSSSAATATALTLGALPRAHATPGGFKNLIMIYLGGGWDINFHLDAKPHIPDDVWVPEGHMENFGVETSDMNIWIPDSVVNDSGENMIYNFFDQRKDISIGINGIDIQSTSHSRCRERMFCGRRDEFGPDVLAISAFELGSSYPIPYYAMGGASYGGYLSSYRGMAGTRNQISSLADHALIDADSEARLRLYNEGRAMRERDLRGQQGSTKKQIQEFISSQQRAHNIREFHADDFGDPGSTGTLEQQIDSAVRAINNDISRTVVMRHRHPDGFSYDTHYNSEDRQSRLQIDLFQNLIQLANTLESTPGKSAGNNLLDETLVVCFSEMSRTLLMNANEPPGKDHWGVTSALAFGGALRGGRMVGETDDQVQGVPIDFNTGERNSSGQYLQYQNFVTGILQAMGVDSTKYFPDVQPLMALKAP